MGCWIKTDAGSQVKLGFYDGSWTYGSENTGSSWEWHEYTKTLADNGSYRFAFLVDNTKVAYISQPILVFGSSIGEGNYTRPQGETVWFESQSTSNLMQGTTGYSTGGWTTINLESDNNGKVPKGIKAAYIKTVVNDSASASTASCRLILHKESDAQILENSVQGLANDLKSHMVGWAQCNNDGDVLRYIFASGSGTFDIGEFVVSGVKLR
jgi:hypothetical protein